VTIIVDTVTKTFEVQLGIPPTSALILKEIGAPKGSATPKTQIVGNLSIDQIKSIAKMKAAELTALTMKSAAMIITGTCVSMGVTIEGKPAKEFQQEIRDGKWDNQLNVPFREG
jgi:large subunit ribosomal protein L11